MMAGQAKVKAKARAEIGAALSLTSTLDLRPGSRGDMVWNALIIVTVLLPLSGLAIDVPRYFALRSRLQAAVDAARGGGRAPGGHRPLPEHGRDAAGRRSLRGRGALGLRDRGDKPPRTGLHGQL